MEKRKCDIQPEATGIEQVGDDEAMTKAETESGLWLVACDM